MPTYDYECAACGHAWEAFQPITENPKRRCPGCGRLKAKRLIGSGAAVLFKGAGFYETDYRSAEYKREAAADKKAASGTPDSGKKADSGKNAKPAPKSKD